MKHLFFILLLSYIIQTVEARQSNPYENQQAIVRIGSSLCNQEKTYLNNRKTKIKTALETYIGPLDQQQVIPTIALCMSGGGYRAMISSLGWFQGMNSNTQRNWLDYLNPNTLISSLSAYLLSWFNVAAEPLQNSQLFESLSPSFIDCCAYCAALSGSTWAITGWYSSRLPLEEYLSHIKDQVSEPLLKDISLERIVQQLLKKEAAGQPVSFIDIYGSILAQKLLSFLSPHDPDLMTLLEYQSVIDAVQVPFPLCTACIGEDVVNYEWVEFSPYEVGSAFLNSFIPTWAFGRKFHSGKSIDYVAPQSLGFGMGIWGSAISVSAEDIFNLFIAPDFDRVNASFLEKNFGKTIASASHLLSSIYENLAISNAQNEDIMGDELSEQRFSPAQVNNWTCHLPQIPLNDKRTLTLVDAGISINLPCIPLLRVERNVNIIIILDASSGEIGNELKKTEVYARQHNLKFPAIHYETINSVISIHKDNDPSVPIVIYMPLIKNENYSNGWDPSKEKFLSTFNVHYTKDQVSLLSGLTKLNMQQSMPIIIDVVKQWVQDHNRANKQ